MSIFERDAPRYDAWYDTARGAALFAEESATLRPLVDELPGPRLEVGVGSGRFASALGVTIGLDPARAPLRLAQGHGVRAMVGVGEALPLRTGSVGTVLLVMTLCFTRDPSTVFRETRRALAPGGGVVLGVVPADGPWDRHYRALAASGHPYYREARFFTSGELVSLVGAAGLVVRRVRASVLWSPDADPPARPRVLEGWDPAAGFVAMLATPATTGEHDRPHPGSSGWGRRPWEG